MSIKGESPRGHVGGHCLLYGLCLLYGERWWERWRRCAVGPGFCGMGFGGFGACSESGGGGEAGAGVRVW